jgi:hypothetical protein
LVFPPAVVVVVVVIVLAAAGLAIIVGSVENNELRRTDDVDMVLCTTERDVTVERQCVVVVGEIILVTNADDTNDKPSPTCKDDDNTIRHKRK